MALGYRRLTVSVPRRGFVVFLQEAKNGQVAVRRRVSVPRRGFVVFLPGRSRSRLDSLQKRVSVPRRGFVVFLRNCVLEFQEALLTSFSPPKGIRCFSTVEGLLEYVYKFQVSVPRRGFVVFLP